MQNDVAAVETTAGIELSGPPLRARGWLRTLDSALGWLVEIPAALLVVAEIGVLLAGVVSRYVFHEPLIWSDELAGILFLWLAMLGAVVAFRRAEHMRMTALVAMAGPRGRAFLETLALVAGLIFVVLVLHPAYEFARCLIPGFDGALFTLEWRDALWAKFFTAAPPRRRQSVERSSIVKRA